MACGCNNQGTNEINTLTCNNETPCSSQCNVTTNCSCGCNPCSCQQAATATPTPFYNCGTAIQETHCQTVVQQQYVTAVTTSTAFNVPACDATAVITIPGLTKIQIGSYLWNPTYGYFEVVSFDYINGQVTIKNTCKTKCNGDPYATVGTSVPSCTMFTVVDPPCTSDGVPEYGIFVTIDFIAPAIGNCLDITVTNVLGLYAGQVVQIGSGQYRVSAIINATLITICNDGNGITPGTLVDAIDINGNYNYPVTPTNTNACGNTPNDTTGAILACKNDVQAPLTGSVAGQVPVLIDPATGEAQYQSLDLPTSVCAIMTSCLNLLAGTEVYTIVVDNSLVFSEHDVVIIHDPLIETYRWEVTDPDPLADGLHLEITLTDPAANPLTASVGCNNTPICLAPCCEQLATGNEICSYDWSAAFKTDTADDDQGAGQNPTIAFPADPGLGPTTYTCEGQIITVENTTCNTMEVIAHIDYQVNSYIATVTGDYFEVALTPYYGSDVVAVGAAFPAPTYVNTNVGDLRDSLVAGVCAGALCAGEEGDPYNHFYSKSFHLCKVFTLAANTKIQIYGRQTLKYFIYVHAGLGSPTGNWQILASITRVNALGVAVQAAP